MHGRKLHHFHKRFLSFSTFRPRPDSTACKTLCSLAANTINSGDSSQILSILRGCHEPSDLQKGRQVHAQIVVNGVDDGVISTRLLGMYVLCRSFYDAKNVFSGLEKGSQLPWNWMIRGFTMMGWFESALLFYFKMFCCGALPDKYTFPYVIKSCCSLSAVGLGRLIHEKICHMGLEADLFVGSSLIKMYADNGSVDEAGKVFEKMPERDCVLWNVMIDGYARNGDSGNCIRLFNSMRVSETKPNSVSLACVLSVCASEAMLKCGIQLHGLTIRLGLELEASVANTLLSMYSKCRCLVDVSKLFSLMPQTDLVSWNGMISGYVQNGLKSEALHLFYKMQASDIKPDAVTLASFLPSLSDSASLRQGKEVHAYILRNDIYMDAFLKSALIDIYSKCKDVGMSKKVFESTDTMDVVICSAMIAGYLLNGLSRDALEIFRWLLKAQLMPNAVTLASVLPACSCLAALRKGKELHGYILKKAFEGRHYVATALVDMYAKCGRLDLGHQIFTNMSHKDTVAWNSMIASFSQNGQEEEAISLFRQMGKDGLLYDCVTISSALSACASLPSLHYGKEIHGFMMRRDLRSDLFAESALIDMYAKCGHLGFARHVFNSMHDKSEASWNSIIAAYGTHGIVDEAVSLFQQMGEVGFQPDHITFLSLISGCSHAGKVEEGFRFFRGMSEEYGIVARSEHYACMVDLFGRAGLLKEALNLITNMPFKPDAGIWGALLGACRVHKNAELAELAANHLFELDPQNSGYYVLMSNTHAVTGRWEGVLRVRSLMKERRVQKVPGCSWIDVNNMSHMFVAVDKSHPDSERIYLCMKNLISELEDEGYVPQPELIYANMDSNKKVVSA